MMRTTIDIKKELLEEAEELLCEESPSKVVNTALAELVRRHRVEQLIAIAGQVELLDNWRELEALELKETKDQTW